MCHIPETLKTHKVFILFLGLFLILISPFILVISPTFFLIPLIIGIILFFASSLLFLHETASGKDSWKNLSIYVMILSFLLWVVIATIKIKSSEIVNIQNTYITIYIAILSVSFAAIAINSDRLITLLKKVKKEPEPGDFPFFEIKRFQGFITVNAFMILFSVFVSVFTSIIPDSQESLYFIYIPSFLFGMTTCMTIFLVFLLMGYLSAIVDKILYPEKYEDPSPIGIEDE